MKEKPIIFRSSMVNAIMNGYKTQTRRLVKDKSKPLTTPGDRLWVKETWADVNTDEGPAICYRADGGYRSWHDFSKKFGPDYGAGPSMDYESYPGDYSMWWEDLLNRDNHGEEGYNWRPSIHMPRWASRLTLDIKSIRIERVQDISDQDIFLEGIRKVSKDNGRTYKYGVSDIDGCPGADNDGWPWQKWCRSPKKAFRKLWESVGGKELWEDNAWVWVVEFEKLN